MRKTILAAVPAALVLGAALPAQAQLLGLGGGNDDYGHGQKRGGGLVGGLLGSVTGTVGGVTGSSLADVEASAGGLAGADVEIGGQKKRRGYSHHGGYGYRRDKGGSLLGVDVELGGSKRGGGSLLNAEIDVLERKDRGYGHGWGYPHRRGGDSLLSADVEVGGRRDRRGRKSGALVDADIDLGRHAGGVGW